jgi:hypothetical protein
MKIPFALDPDHRRAVLGAEPMIFHCHHYNCFLQRTILDAGFRDWRPLLVGAAAEVAHAQLSQLYAEHSVGEIAARKTLAESVYRWAGFGSVALDGLDEKGGTVETPHSHYATGWRSKWGSASSPVCYFDSGFLAGALAAVYGLPNGAFSVENPTCIASGGAANTFRLQAGEANYDVLQSVGVGPLSTHRPRAVPENHVDYEGIFAALTSMELSGGADGMMPAFGVYLTRHYANYYNRISFGFERALTAEAGVEGRETAVPLLVEAGRICAFHTFGGIMTSTEWDALIRPSLKTQEDWVHGMVAATNALGWGRWQVTRVSATEAEFVIHDDYESIGHLAMYGRSDHPVSYLAQGGAAGLMNLVYIGNIADKPELTEAFYESVFRRPDVFRAVPLSSRAMGDEVTAFRVFRD